MRQLKFHSVRARNILCFGSQGVEVCFSDFGNVTIIRGINLDLPGTPEGPASNASGKSSFPELLSIGLYGRTVKAPGKCRGGDKILNCLAEQGEVEVRWDDYRLVRSYRRTKSSVTAKLRLWKSAERIWDDDSEISKGAGSDETQKEIEAAIGLSHHAFCNVALFDDSEAYSFLEADAEQKREIVENLLDLGQYRQYHDNAKEALKTQKRLRDELRREYERLRTEADAASRRHDDLVNKAAAWRNARLKEVGVIDQEILRKAAELDAFDGESRHAEWHRSQEKMRGLYADADAARSLRVRVENVVTTTRQSLERITEDKRSAGEEVERLYAAAQSAKAEAERLGKLADKLQTLREGERCPYCQGTVRKEDFAQVLARARTEASSAAEISQQAAAVVEQARARFGSKAAGIGEIESRLAEAGTGLTQIDNKIRKLMAEADRLARTPRPESTGYEALEAEVMQARRRRDDKLSEASGPTPYEEILVAAAVERNAGMEAAMAKAVDLEAAEAEIPYGEYWVDGFGDNGIRRHVVNGVVPALNEQVSYWLHVLIDGRISLRFDERFEETIARNGNPAVYPMMAKSERRRLNLAISQAFAHVMMLVAGCCPSLIFLDEITGGGIDRPGVIGVYNLIMELARDRQVFVATHDESLLALLHGCNNINLRKQNDTTDISR